MKHLIIFRLIIIIVGIFADKDPFCKEKHRFANPRECCLDPKLITFDIIEKCRTRMDHISEVEPQEKPQNEYADQIGSDQLFVKPVVSNGIKRDTVPKRRLNPFDLNEYGDSDEKINYKKSKDSSSGSSSESEEHNRKVNHRNKHYKDHHKCKPHKSHDLSSSESNSVGSSSSESQQNKKHHKGGHKHHSHHHKHHHRHHDGRHHHGGRQNWSHHKGGENYQLQKHNGYQFNKFSCFMECVFNETRIIENKTVNMDNVNTYLTEVLQLNDDYLPIVTDAIEICGKIVAEMRQKIQELPVMPMMPMISLMPHQGYKNEMCKSKKCKPWAGYLMMCIKAQVFINCPIENFRTDDMRCNNTREFMKSCPKQSARIPYYFSNKRRSFSKN